MTDKEAAYVLLGIVQNYAPTALDQEKVAAAYRDAQAAGATDRELVKLMANALADGLTHGNWPWS